MSQRITEQKVPLGSTDVRVSPLGLGAWSWGDRFFWGFGHGYGRNDIHAAFESSLAAAIDFVDTAEVYGNGQSERYLGQFLLQIRQPVLVATKFFPFPWRWRRSSVVQALRKSLKRLQLSRVDLYQIHHPFPPVPIETWMAGLADVVEAGLARTVGVSNYNAEQTRRAHAALADRGIPLASNQVKYSLLDRHIERDGTLQTCRELNITVIAYSPIEQGVLTGRYTPTHPPPGIRGRRYSKNYLTRLEPAIRLLGEIGSAHGGKTPSQVALNWVMCKGAVPIPGAKNLRQAQENAGALGWRLTANEVDALDHSGESA